MDLEVMSLEIFESTVRRKGALRRARVTGVIHR